MSKAGKNIGILSGIILTAGVVCAVIGLSKCNFDVRKLLKTDDYRWYEKCGEINARQALTIDFDYGDITLSSSPDAEAITVKYYADVQEDIKITQTDTLITVAQDYDFASNWWDAFYSFKLERKYEIIIPEQTYGSLTVSLGSGQLVARNLQAHNLTFKMSSGSLQAEKISGDNLSARVSSGSLRVSDAAFEAVNLHLSSGKIAIDKFSAVNTNFSVSSGKLVLNYLSPRPEYTITVGVSSGSCNVADQIGSDNAKLIAGHVSSGRVELNFAA